MQIQNTYIQAFAFVNKPIIKSVIVLISKLDFYRLSDV